MTSLPQVAQALQTVLTTAADHAAQATHFVQRHSKLTGARFAQTLVFGWLANAQATLEDLSQTAAACGLTITAQGLDQRFTPAAAACLQAIVRVAMDQLVRADPVAIPLLHRFPGVYLLDSSTIVLPDALASIWPGCGGSRPTNTSAALKLQVGLDLCTGSLVGLDFQPGRAHDSTAVLQTMPLPAGTLRLADLGYFDLDALAILPPVPVRPPLRQ